MDLQKEREAFENHLKKMGKTDNETFSKNEDDSYQMDIIHFGWKIWQAAKAQAVPEGFALAPIEITPKQIEAYMKGKVFPASMGEHRKFVERLSKDYTAMIEAAQEPAND